MHTEIERKFIVTDSTFKQSAVRIMDIRQGYVGTSSNGEARVSIRDEKAWGYHKVQRMFSKIGV